MSILLTESMKISRKEPDRLATKASVSLYGTDLERVNEVRDFMRERGLWISKSNAIQLCLRSARVDERLLKIYEKIQSEDNRRKA
jgi:hypothetical protein